MVTRRLAAQALHSNSSRQHAIVVLGSEGQAACDHRIQLRSDTVRVEEVPDYDRCQRQGCKQIWPKPKED